MIPQRITLENFLSFGEPVTLEFTDDEPLWVLGGPNGVGKSAVFDAITFALFGVHRGGKLRVDELIRHGATGFKVVFEFGFDGNNYRITRGYNKGRVLPPKLDVRTADEWTPLVGITKVNELNDWVKQKFGMDYEAFTSSVMLMQGQADKLLSATRSERVDTLKNIIGFEDYEKLADSVKAAANATRSEFTTATTLYGSLSPVDESQLTAATKDVEAAEAQANAAQSAKEAAIRREGAAKQWASLNDKLKGVNDWLSQAAERAKTAEDVQAKHTRLRGLNSVLPVLENLTAIRGELAKLTEKQTAGLDKQSRLKEQHDAAVAAANAATLEAESFRKTLDTAKTTLDDAKKQLPLLKSYRGFASEIDTLQSQLQQQPDAGPQLVATTDEEAEADKALKAADAEFNQSKARLDTARDNLKEMQTVKVGVKCSRCRQTVTAEHAEAEKVELTAAVESFTKQHTDAEAAAKAAKQRHATAKAALATVTLQHQAREQLSKQIQQQTSNLSKLGVTATTAELKQQIQQWEQRQSTATIELKPVETQSAAAMDTAVKQAEAAKIADKSLRKLEPELAAAAATVTGLESRIAGELARLQAPWTEADAANLNALTAEQTALRDERIEERALDLQKDSQEIESKRATHADLVREIDNIPETDRVTVAAATIAVQTAEEKRKAAETAFALAKEALRKLAEDDKHYRAVETDLRAKERANVLHKKLDALLGDAGLMRDLIRDAERDVVALADETLRQLTNQDLSLELDNEEEKTFALQIRKAGDDNVTAVEFISGSQRFRVAVSLALAIGRYAAGKRRPIEAVIIDEGFGSLDEDGLRAMAENLQDLRRTQALKRIILVSHQPNFTSQFPAGYRLSPSPTGTTAERI
ncbi:exonuclease SbcCD subunit SbcC [soil metagenome]